MTGSVDENVCQRCDGPNVVWYAPSPLWNTVMNYPDEPFHGIVCPTCFAILAQEAGVATIFRLSAAKLLVKLPTVHTDGRVWNPETDLWEDPS